MSDKPIVINAPGNSHVSKERREEAREQPRTKRVTRGKIRRKKKSWVTKLSDSFLADTDATSVVEYIVHDVLIQAAKGMIDDMLRGSLDMMLWGDRGSGRSRRDRRDRDGRSHVSYTKYYDDRDRDRTRRSMSDRARSTHEFDEIILDSRGEAEEVMDCLGDIIYKYGQATVADLYDLVGITAKHTDYKYGWTDLRNAKAPSRIRDGYLLNLPRTTLIE